MFGDMGKMLKEAKEMKSRLKQAEKELESEVVSRSSKNGHVVCTMDGKLKVKGIEIAPELVQKNDKNLLEKSVAEAVSATIEEAQAVAAKKLSAITGGLSIPGLF